MAFTGAVPTGHRRMGSYGGANPACRLLPRRHGYLDSKRRPRAATNLLERLEDIGRRLARDVPSFLAPATCDTLPFQQIPSSLLIARDQVFGTHTPVVGGGQSTTVCRAIHTP
jgi:hypothetical protein